MAETGQTRTTDANGNTIVTSSEGLSYTIVRPATGVPLPSTTTTSGSGTSPGNGTPTQPTPGDQPPPPRIIKNFEITQKLLRPSLTSHFQCWFNPPKPIRDSSAGQYYLDGGELISLLCSEASLPGSSVITNEVNDDYTGVTERLGYRRQYDDRSDFTFYVDHKRQNGSYNVIMFFEEWIRYAMGETNYAPDSNYHYRVNFPDGEGGQFGTGYRTNMFITKFERDFAGNYLEYTFVQAYPISITSMPVSYDSSEILKCTVSFTYNRYIVNRLDNRITKEELERALDAGIASGVGAAAGSMMAQELLNNKSSGGQPPLNTREVPLW
jgi:hypothetical protein